MKFNTKIIYILILSVCVLLFQPIMVSAKSMLETTNQDQTISDYKYSKTFNETASCLHTVMEGKVSWGGETNWSYQNAMNLCRNSQNAINTLDCFNNTLKLQVKWQHAITTC